jgi:hypothetical protein
MQFERGQKQIWLVWAYSGSFYRPEGGPLWPQMCGTVQLDTVKAGGHDTDIPWEILGKDDPLTLRKRDFHRKSQNSGSRKITENNVFV